MRYLLSLSCLILFSCASMKQKDKSSASSSSSAVSLKGTVWTVTRIPGYEMEKTKRPVTISLSDTATRYGGYGGCNGYGGDYTLNGDSLKLGQVLSTMMACKPGSSTEVRFFKALAATNKYNISKGKLLLKNGNTTLVELTADKKD